jgi:VCBS repeat-containing protein
MFISQDSDYDPANPHELIFTAKVTAIDGGPGNTDDAVMTPNYESGTASTGTTGAATFNWTPDTAGTYQVVVKVTDEDGNSVSQTFTIHVSSPPKIQVNGTTTPVTLSATPELPLAIPVAVSDPDDHETLTVSLDSNAPSGMTVKSPGTFSNVPGNTPRFTELDFTPTDSQANTSYTFNVTVTDSSGQTATQQVTVNVGAVNAAPVIVSPTSGSTVNMVTGHDVSLPVVATDADGDTLTYSSTDLTATTGLNIDSSTGIISGTAPAAGTYPVTVTVDDGYHVSPSSVTFKIVVGDSSTNHVPTLGTIANQALVVGQTFSVQAVGGDQDNDKLTYTISNNPTWVHIDQDTGLITSDPAVEGTWTVTVTVSDGYGGTASQNFVLTVNGPFSVSTTSGDGYVTITYTVTNTTGSTISPIVRGNLTGVGYTRNEDAFFNASQGFESDQWASPKIQRDLDPSKSARIITWTVGSLAPGASATLAISVPIKSNTPNGTQLTNQWTVDYSGSPELTVAPVVLGSTT